MLKSKHLLTIVKIFKHIILTFVNICEHFQIFSINCQYCCNFSTFINIYQNFLNLLNICLHLTFDSICKHLIEFINTGQLLDTDKNYFLIARARDQPLGWDRCPYSLCPLDLNRRLLSNFPKIGNLPFLRVLDYRRLTVRISKVH